MDIKRITILLGALAVIVVAIVNLSTESANAKTSASLASTEQNRDGGAAVQAIEKAAATIRQSEAWVWRDPLLVDAALELLSATRELAIEAEGLQDGVEANGILDLAAWSLDVAIHRVDGEAGVSDTAHEDDWVTEASSAARLHELLVQARSEVLRAKRE